MRRLRGAGASSGGASPLSGRSGSAANQASISLDSHIELPPTIRDLGNLPSRIHTQIVGYVFLVSASISCFVSRPTGGADFWFTAKPHSRAQRQITEASLAAGQICKNVMRLSPEGRFSRSRLRPGFEGLGDYMKPFGGENKRFRRSHEKEMLWP
jgi:hypothetical protein